MALARCDYGGLPKGSPEPYTDTPEIVSEVISDCLEARMANKVPLTIFFENRLCLH
jgi:hypothetical protein